MSSKTLGGDRLGSGGGMRVQLHNYGRSTHDLGKVIRTTQSTGTLVPIYTEFVKAGDVWEIDLGHMLRTHPTNGPIFGTWKLQVDVFTMDIRLYQKRLHNNLTGIGLNMASVLLPQMDLYGPNPNVDSEIDMNQQQIAPDSWLAYAGIRGLGTLDPPNGEGIVNIRRNAIPLLGYWDIYKEYYSNKQEEIGNVITAEPLAVSPNLENANILGGTSGSQVVAMLDQQGQTGVIYTVSGTNTHRISIAQSGITLAGTHINFSVDSVGPSEDITLEELINTYGAILEEDGANGGQIRIGNLQQGWTFWAFGSEYNGAGIYNADEPYLGFGDLTIEEFPLSNIDETREEIFAQPNTSPYLVSINTNVGQRLPYQAVVGVAEGELGITNFSAATMAGLGVKTYKSDRFNNWLLTEWIEQINAASAVDTSTGSFTMDALNVAKKFYKIDNDIAVAGDTYQDWMEATQGIKITGAPEMPVYRGGMSSTIVFEEVISSSDATTAQGWDQPLGTLGGRGTGTGNRHGHVRFKAEEHGWVMIIASLTPDIDYFQGNKWWGKLSNMDEIHKPGFDQIGFQELLTDEMAAWDTKVTEGLNGVETFFSAGKQPSWIHYQTNQNEIYGNFARANSERFMILAREYTADENGRIEDLTTYIDPVKYNYPFAYVELDSQPFWMQYSVDAKVRRVMSANQMPNV